MLAAASTRDGGGARAAIPGHTATDEAGRVSGYKATNYAKKGGRQPDLPGAPADQPPARYTGGPGPGAGAAQSSLPPSTPTPAAPTPARTGAARFSSLSGFRRR